MTLSNLYLFDKHNSHYPRMKYIIEIEPTEFFDTKIIFNNNGTVTV